jgi:hypothetical protein
MRRSIIRRNIRYFATYFKPICWLVIAWIIPIGMIYVKAVVHMSTPPRTNFRKRPLTNDECQDESPNRHLSASRNSTISISMMAVESSKNTYMGQTSMLIMPNAKMLKK